MATCLRYGYAGNLDGTPKSAVNYLMNDAGSAVLSPNTLATFLLPDTATSDISQCAAVGLTGSEYHSIMAVVSAGSSGTVATQTYPAWNELGSLSVGDAQVISLYVGALWAGVWGIKQIAKAFSPFERNQDE